MKITYDHEVDALYIQFKDTTVTTKHLADGIAADYDAPGRLADIVLWQASHFGVKPLMVLKGGVELDHRIKELPASFPDSLLPRIEIDSALFERFLQ